MHDMRLFQLTRFPDFTEFYSRFHEE